MLVVAAAFQIELMIDVMNRVELPSGSIREPPAVGQAPFCIVGGGICEVGDGHTMLSVGGYFGESHLYNPSEAALPVSAMGGTPLVLWTIDRVTYRHIIIATTAGTSPCLPCSHWLLYFASLSISVIVTA